MLKILRIFLFSSFIFLAPQLLVSAVPVTPFSLSRAEMMAILKDPRLYEILGTGQRILDIQSCQDGYLISATKNQIMVKVHYLPQSDVIGVTDFELEFIAAEELLNVD